MADKVRFQIIENVEMSKEGVRHWKHDKRIFRTVFKPIRVQELKDKIPCTLVDTKDKLVDYIYSRCGQGTFDLRITLPSKAKNRFKSCTFVRITIKETDPIQGTYVCTDFDTKGKRNKFGMRYGIWKRIVDWKDDF